MSTRKTNLTAWLRLAILMTGLLVYGCRPEQVSCNNDFSRFVPKGWKIVSHIPLATDNKDQLQCIVFYRFGQVQGDNSPISGMVIYQNLKHPSEIYAYPLEVPGGRYLGEHQVSARVAPALTAYGSGQIIIEDRTAEGVVVEASIFQWRGSDKPENGAYESLGWFVGDSGVTIELDEVNVLTRRLGTRSQLADRRIYKPRDGKNYYQNDSIKMVAPETTDLVSLSMPDDAAKSPYPEQVVLSFYENMIDVNKLQGLLSPDTLRAFLQHDPSFGCLVDPNRIGVLVKVIDYNDAEQIPPHTSNSNVVIDGTVIVTSTCILNDNGIRSMKDMRLVWPVRWEKYDEYGKSIDRWILLNPTAK